MEQTFLGLAGILLMLGTIGLYGLPSIIAVLRKAPSVGSVIVINIFLGWTFVGWVVALAMAVRSRPPQVVMAPPPWAAGQPLPGQQQLPTQERRGELSPPSQEENG